MKDKGTKPVRIGIETHEKVRGVAFLRKTSMRKIVEAAIAASISDPKKEPKK